MQLKKKSLKKIEKLKKFNFVKYNQRYSFMSPFIAHNSIENRDQKKSLDISHTS